MGKKTNQKPNPGAGSQDSWEEVTVWSDSRANSLKTSSPQNPGARGDPAQTARSADGPNVRQLIKKQKAETRSRWEWMQAPLARKKKEYVIVDRTSNTPVSHTHRAELQSSLQASLVSRACVQ